MSKTIYLKEWVQPMAELHAICVVEDELGLTDPKSSEYQREFEKAFSDFCEEYYTHSLVPLAGNPATIQGVNSFRAFTGDLFPKVDAVYPDKTVKGFARQAAEEGRLPEELYNEYQQLKMERMQSIPTAWKNDTSWFKKHFPARSLSDIEEALENAKQLKKAVGTIVRIYLAGNTGKVGPTKETVEGTKTRYQYELAGKVDKSKRKESNREVEIARFVRMFLLSSILAHVKQLYEVDASKLYQTIADDLKQYTSGDLRKKEVNLGFSESIKDFIKDSSEPDMLASYMKWRAQFKR